MLSAPCSFWWAGLNFLTPRARNKPITTRRDKLFGQPLALRLALRTL